MKPEELARLREWASRFDERVSAPVGVGPRPADLRAALNHIERLEEALREARGEIIWWREEHGCCFGHEQQALAKIDAALGEGV